MCGIIIHMNVDLSRYANKKICVACSGGRDSMALLHYLYNNAAQYNIALSALNCDHGMREEESARDSAFVVNYCKKAGIPLLFFKACGLYKSESQARLWRVFRCYAVAHADSEMWKEKSDYNALGTKPKIYSSDGKWSGCNAVATAHHMDDNAETVLFNLARGSGLAGMCGIEDDKDGCGRAVIHPFVSVTRREIDEYVEQNNIPYVDDSSNFSDDYTRNYIRHNVLPALEKAVPGAAKAIFRFSRLAADDEEYFARKVGEIVADFGIYGYKIARCTEPVIFKRAALYVIERYQKKDYTSDQAHRLYNLQFAERGKKFEFLGLAAVNEGDGVVIYDKSVLACDNGQIAFRDYTGATCGGQPLAFGTDEEDVAERARLCGNMPLRTLTFDVGCIPEGAVIRAMKPGDKFKKFGGGTKNLGDFLTDKKISAYLRKIIPVIACGSDILMVCGVEISDGIKVTEATKKICFCTAVDYSNL